MAARSPEPRQGSRALAHYLPRALYPAWIQGLRVTVCCPCIRTTRIRPGHARFLERRAGGGAPPSGSVARGVLPGSL
jgi:hypothetical protein